MRAIILIGVVVAVSALVFVLVTAAQGRARRRRRAAAKWEHFSRYESADSWIVGVELVNGDETFDQKVMHRVPATTPISDLLDLEGEAITRAGRLNGGTP